MGGITIQRHRQHIVSQSVPSALLNPTVSDSEESAELAPAAVVNRVAAWVQQERAAGRPMSQNAACGVVFGVNVDGRPKKNAGRMALIKQAFAILGLLEGAADSDMPG